MNHLATLTAALACALTSAGPSHAALIPTQTMIENFDRGGALYLKQPKLQTLRPPQAIVEYARAESTPWSWDWLAFNDNGLLAKMPGEKHSPAEKFGRYIEATYPEKKGVKQKLLKWEWSHHSLKTRPDLNWFEKLVHWEGHCDGLAAASILWPEPQTDIIRSGIKFTPADQKALLVELHLDVQAEVYGHRDGTPRKKAELDPQLFHRLLQYYIRDEQVPFVLDFSPGSSVHNHPIYEYRTELSPILKKGRATGWYSVTTDVVYADFADPEFAGGTDAPNKRSVKTFYYLFRTNDQGQVIESRWDDGREANPRWENLRRTLLRNGDITRLNLRHANFPCVQDPGSHACEEDQTYHRAPVGGGHRPDFAWVPFWAYAPGSGNPWVKLEWLTELLL